MRQSEKERWAAWPPSLRIPLRVKFVAFGCILALLPLALVGTQRVTITRDELKSAANEELTRVAAGVAEDIDSSFRGRFLSPLTVIRNAIDSADLGVQQKIAILTHGIEGAPDLKALQITIEGAPLPILVTAEAYAAELEAAGVDPSSALRTTAADLETILRGSQSGRPVVDRLEATDSWLATVALPLDAQLAGRDLVLSARVDLEVLSERLRRNPFVQRGEIAIVDREDDTSATPLIEAAGRALTLEGYTRPNGDAMLGAFAFIDTFPWAVVAELRERDAYAVVAQMTRSVLFVAAFGIGAAIIGSIFTAQRARQSRSCASALRPRGSAREISASACRSGASATKSATSRHDSTR